jgi:hypothetical protein
MPDSAIETQQNEQTNEQEQAELSALDRIDELLNAPPGEKPEGEKPEGEAPDGEKPEGEKPEGEAEPAPEIDYELEIPMPSGEKVTVGKLKDLWQQQAQATLELQERENALGVQTSQLEKLAEWVGAVPADVKQAALVASQNQLVTEHQALIKAIPAWNDRTAYEAGRARIFDLAKEYGIEGAVADIIDHRAVKMLHDFAALKDAVKAAKLNLKPIDKARPKPHLVSKGGKPTEAQVLADRAKQTGKVADQIAAIDKLLK